MALQNLPGVGELIRHLLVNERKSHEQISVELQRAYPDVRGLSTRSVRRFCASEGVQRTSRLPDDQLDRVIFYCVQSVC